MLSFDITDRHIRVIRGTEARGKIRVAGASTIDLNEGLIVNGHIKDIPKMATIINDELKSKRMNDKEAVISISSNLIVFKELHVPKSKGAQLLTMVQNQMQHTMGITDDYSISYTIVGEIEEEGVQAMKVLATACPFEIVDCFRKVFSMLGIALKSVAVSCNCITRIILSDNKLKAKMPLLLVQIDPNFVSLNLYENNQLTFSRFASIDAVDYENSPDYIYEAVNENIFRMFQFQKSRNGEDAIQNVIFYGDTSEYIRLTNSLEQMDITTGLLGVPNFVGGYENFEFQAYANAIGAMFKSNKDYERINLLEVDAAAGRTGAGASLAVALAAAAGISIAVVAAVTVALNFTLNQYTKDINEINEEMNSPEMAAKIAEVDSTQTKIDKVELYRGGLQNVTDAFATKPIINSTVMAEINSCLKDTKAVHTELSYLDGIITIKGVSPTITDPSLVVQKLNELDYFDNITYQGYELKDEEGQEGALIPAGKKYEFEVSMQIRTKYVAPVETPPAEDPAAVTTAAEEGGAQ